MNKNMIISIGENQDLQVYLDDLGNPAKVIKIDKDVEDNLFTYLTTLPNEAMSGAMFSSSIDLPEEDGVDVKALGLKGTFRDILSNAFRRVHEDRKYKPKDKATETRKAYAKLHVAMMRILLITDGKVRIEGSSSKTLGAMRVQRIKEIADEAVEATKNV